MLLTSLIWELSPHLEPAGGGWRNWGAGTFQAKLVAYLVGDIVTDTNTRGGEW